MLYQKTLARLKGSVLVVCGGSYDAQMLRACGITDAVISNLSPNGHGNQGTTYEGFEWSHQDAEALTYADGSFDWCVVNAGLHHCASPHKALIEMLRVSRVGVLVVESRDSLLMRAAMWFGMTPAYEIETVALNGYDMGGLRNGSVPNFIYRWTEREVRKTIASAYPERTHDIEFFYDILLPTRRLSMSSLPKRIAFYLLAVGVKCFHAVAKRQCNQFAFVVRKGPPQPWIQDGGLRKDFVKVKLSEYWHQ